jgi:hypothetical protein
MKARGLLRGIAANEDARNPLIMLVFVFITSCTSDNQVSLLQQRQGSTETSVSTESSPQNSFEPTETKVRAHLFRPVNDFPGVVTGLQREGEIIGVVDNSICIFLEQAYFWRPGERWSTFDDLPLVSIELNDQPIQDLHRFMSGLLQIEYDRQGQEIGYHGFSFDFCFLLDRQSEVRPTNTLSMNVVTKLGEAYRYSWDFIDPLPTTI